MTHLNKRACQPLASNTESGMMLFSGNANPQLAHNIASCLDLSLAKAEVGRFSDGEILVEILENVRGRDVFIIQPTSAPTNDHLMELIIMADALRRASAGRITAVIPYFGYARQDRRVRSARVPITAKVVADLMSCVGISRLLTVDLHADQIQGFFYIPVDNIYATPEILQDIKMQSYQRTMVVSPYVGGVVRARAIAKRLNDADLAIIDKRRQAPNRSEVMHLMGDVAGRDCIIVDDIIDTAGTLCNAATELKNRGATAVSAYITHPVLSGQAIDNLNRSDLDAIVVTNTIALSDSARECAKLRCINISSLLANAIERVHKERSVSSMFAE